MIKTYNLLFNTVPDNYASAKIAYLRPHKIQFRITPYKPKGRPLSRGYIITFVLKSLICQMIYLPLEINITLENNNSHMKYNYPTEIIENLL